MKVVLKVTKQEAMIIVEAMEEEEAKYYGLQQTNLGLTKTDTDNGAMYTWLTSGGAKFTIDMCNFFAIFEGRRHACRGKWFEELHNNEVVEYITEAPYLKWFETNDGLKQEIREFILNDLFVGNILSQIEDRFPKVPKTLITSLYSTVLEQLKEEYKTKLITMDTLTL